MERERERGSGELNGGGRVGLNTGSKNTSLDDSKRPTKQSSRTFEAGISGPRHSWKNTELAAVRTRSDSVQEHSIHVHNTLHTSPPLLIQIPKKRFILVGIISYHIKHIPSLPPSP